MDRQQTTLIAGLLFVFTVAIGVAYLYGDGQSAASTSTDSAPIKKFRAKPGTERKGARALVSSRSSASEETTNRPIEIWGSLEPERESKSEAQRDLENTVTEKDTQAEIERILNELTDPAVLSDPGDYAYRQAALAVFYTRSDPPDLENAVAAFRLADESAPTLDDRIGIIYLFSEALYSVKAYREIVEATRLENIESYLLSAELVEVGVMRGVALEQLGFSDEALKAYDRLIDLCIGYRGEMTRREENAFRQASIHLARIYRGQGKPTRAKAVARRVQALLDD